MIENTTLTGTRQITEVLGVRGWSHLDAVLLASLATQAPLLLIGPHGTAKSLLVERLVGCMPASRFEMETLCRLTDIKTTRQLPSAAVECTRRPRLLINPDFVKEHCKHAEHLFLLVMHELWHIMLAHTQMYPRMTGAQNITFEAIINAGLMRHFSHPEYRGFFEGINAADKFPHCLLRPPVGWSMNPLYPEDIGPPGTKAL